MTLPNRNEPATKFWGPNYPIVESFPPSKVIVQLHNLKAGQFWRPVFINLVHKKVTLLPLPGQFIWQHLEGPFRWRWVHRVNRIQLEVRDMITPANVFDITLYFLQTRWMLSELRVAAGNYAFAGTATLAWKDVQRQ